jgi:hypothetical protein
MTHTVKVLMVKKSFLLMVRLTQSLHVGACPVPLFVFYGCAWLFTVQMPLCAFQHFSFSSLSVPLFSYK